MKGLALEFGVEQCSIGTGTPVVVVVSKALCPKAFQVLSDREMAKYDNALAYAQQARDEQSEGMQELWRFLAQVQRRWKASFTIACTSQLGLHQGSGANVMSLFGTWGDRSCFNCGWSGPVSGEGVVQCPACDSETELSDLSRVMFDPHPDTLMPFYHRLEQAGALLLLGPMDSSDAPLHFSPLVRRSKLIDCYLVSDQNPHSELTSVQMPLKPTEAIRLNKLALC
ncbi:hypothetical protein [Ferrimonas marina]|uniref:Uncharacterized protein n=1 Tax=Ferrimonas marina TaxID=299255 RepID=A0A1M5T968_9GAMM|nr:hypothetical protein [Ferrimonas marina]SHH47160.1 hypothetical protein SAMN02745129_2044 [Ferrimonas marina]